MTDREKLIELLSENLVEYCNVDIIAGHCKIRAITFDVDRFADHLLANGVTFATDNNVGRWIPVSERLPEDLVDVLTCDAMGHIHVFWHHHEYKHPFNISEHDLRYFPVTHWIPLPEPPKE